MTTTFVAYRRVSTTKQGESGLGLEAQDAAISRHIEGADGKLLASYVEVESGRDCERVELAKALAHARRSRATLVIAKIDRLARNAAFLLAILDSGVDVVAADNPSVNRLTLQLLAVLAEDEAKRISERTKQALAALKARGVLLGSARPDHWQGREEQRRAGLEKATAKAAALKGVMTTKAYEDLMPVLHEMRQQGMTLEDMAKELNKSGHTTRQGKPWNRKQIWRVMRTWKKTASSAQTAQAST